MRARGGRHDPYARGGAICAQLGLWQQRVQLDLQDLRRHAAARQRLLELLARPVGEADGAHLATGYA